MPTTDTASLIVSCKTQGQANLDRINQSLTGMDGFAKRAIGTFAGFFAASKIFQFGKQAVGAFQETQDAAWQFSQTFQNLQGSAEKVFKDFSNTYGLSEKSARSMLSMTGDLLKGAGFSEESALKLSEATAKMATDLAGYRNYSGGAQGATMALSKAMLGEAESMKSLGVVINQNSDQYKEFFNAFRGGGMSIEEVRKKMGEFSSSDAKVTAQWESMIKLMANGKNLSEQEAKAMTALALTLKQTKQAVGDWIKEGESFSQTLLNQKELATDLSAQIGKMIYDTLGLNDKITSFNNLMKTAIEYLKTEGKTWSFAFQTTLIDIGSAVQIFYRLSFAPMVSGVITGFKNIVSVGEWANKNWSKIMDGMGKKETNIFAGFGKDVGQFFKDIFQMQVAQEKMKMSAFSGAAGNRKANEDTLKAAGEFAYAANKTVGNVFRNTEETLKRAGVGAFPKLAQADLSGWTEPGKVIDEILKANKKAQEKLKKDFENSLASAPKDTKTNAEEATSALEQFNKTLTKIRQTAIDAVYAGSVESVRLQSRVFSLASGARVSKVTKGQEAQKTAESSVKTAEHTKKMVALLERIANKNGFATSTIG